MSRLLLLTVSLLLGTQVNAQNASLTTLEFVEIINDAEAEALFYFQNNWQVLRKQALAKEFISDYKLLQVESSPEAPFHIVLMTTFADEQQYQDREKNFRELIEARDGLKLLNDKKPAEFRRSVFSKERARSL